MLKGIEKIHLEPGESKTVTFTLRRPDLGFWGIDRKWVTEPGMFGVMAGDRTAEFELK